MRFDIRRITAIVCLLAIATAAVAVAKADGGDKEADKRERNQKRRIEQGIAHGQLTPDETSRLQKEEENIKSMQKEFNKDSDGKLTPGESKKLEQQLNDASLLIWAERHNTDGNQKPESRLGKDVFANSQITQEIESGSLTHAQAQKFLEDEGRMVHMKNRLSTDDLTDAQRTQLQNRYNDLLNQYFVVKN